MGALKRLVLGSFQQENICIVLALVALIAGAL